MSLDFEKFKQIIEEDLKNPKGFASKISESIIRKDERIVKLNAYLESLSNTDKDSFVYRLINKHTEEYRDACYEQGCEPYALNLMELLFDTASKYGYIYEPKETEEIYWTFPNVVMNYLGFYFQIIWGQGSFLMIYDKNKQSIFTIG